MQSSTLPTPAPDRIGSALRRFRHDTAYYAKAVLRIQTKRAATVPFDFNRAQALVETKVEAQLAHRGYVRALILKARQEGISTWVAARVFRGCTLWKGRNGLVVADTTDRSGSLFRIYERFYDHSPPEVRPAKRTSRRAQEMLFNRPDGQGLDSQIAVETAGSKEPGRGLTRWYLHLSEFAFWPNPTEGLLALLQTVPDDSGEVYIESTANGVGNEFHAQWESAEAGENEWLAIFLPWWIHEEYTTAIDDAERAVILATDDKRERAYLDEGLAWEGETWKLTPEQLAWRRWKIANSFAGDERGFRQEYPATAEEAFLVSGNAFFDEEALEDYRKLTLPPKLRGNFEPTPAGRMFRPAERGYVRIWELPEPEGHYVMGGDTAEGRLAAARDSSLSDPDAERGGRDFSSADVLKVSELVKRDGKDVRVPCLRQVATIHGRMAPEVFAEQVLAASNLFSCPGPGGARARRRQALTAIERNHSSGQTVLKILNGRHAALYSHRRMNVRKDAVTVQLGWVTSGETRMPMLDELSAAIRDGSIQIFDADTIREMRTFVRGDDGRPEAQEGAHDDRVIALAIGVQMARVHTDEPAGEIPELEVADTPTGV